MFKTFVTSALVPSLRPAEPDDPGDKDYQSQRYRNDKVQP